MSIQKASLGIGLLLLAINCASPGTAEQIPSKSSSYVFEGSEPYWNMSIEGERISLQLNDEYTGTIQFSSKASRGETIGFYNREISGIINKPWAGYCEYAITEEDSLSLEVLFIYDGMTFKGCGNRNDSND